ncbi:hypothetical protein EIM50_23230 [Pseudoxanthomonas sp. SGD-10]|nr:hypothetical protein EIM50_23230 [Pseudoxanthomonas sp. SGD-10]
MKPLIVLLSVFIISTLFMKLFRGSCQLALSGRIAMSVMLVFTSVAHFVFTEGMVMMLPGFIPFEKELVYLTGVIELLAGITLMLPSLRITTAWLLIVFFILVLPANIYAAVNHVDYQNATYNGEGPNYLWFRIPLQLLFIAWVYISAIKANQKS